MNLHHANDKEKERGGKPLGKVKKLNRNAYLECRLWWEDLRWSRSLLRRSWLRLRRWEEWSRPRFSRDRDLERRSLRLQKCKYLNSNTVLQVSSKNSGKEYGEKKIWFFHDFGNMNLFTYRSYEIEIGIFSNCLHLSISFDRELQQNKLA